MSDDHRFDLRHIGRVDADIYRQAESYRVTRNGKRLTVTVYDLDGTRPPVPRWIVEVRDEQGRLLMKGEGSGTTTEAIRAVAWEQLDDEARPGDDYLVPLPDETGASDNYLLPYDADS